jgi:hypothetical protein
MTTVLALLPAAVAVAASPASAGEEPDPPRPGTATSAPDSRYSRLSAAEQDVFGGLHMVVNERGRISRSIAAIGTSSSGPVPLSIQKPRGATVRKAYLAFASRGYSYQPLTESPLLEGQPVPLARETPSPMGAYNYFAEVTDQVRPTIDAAAAGSVDVMLTETDSYYHEGTVLVVVFDDPVVPEPQSVTLLFGAINPAGDTYGVTLTEPIDTSDPDTHMDMSLGISYGYQQYGDQYSTIDVNGRRLTTSAGGADDGELANGALVTGGGVGDSLSNPDDPYALPTSGERSDDELYDLLPFVQDGDTTVQVSTDNPSGDDNVFLATLTMNPPVRNVTTDGDTLSVTPELQSVPAGLDARWSSAIPDGGLSGLFAPWRAEITAGPNVGRDFAFGCDVSTCLGSFLRAPLYLRPREPFETGTDVVRIWYDLDGDGAVSGDEQFADVGIEWLDPADQVAMGDSYSSGEGVNPYDSGTDDDWGDNRNQCHRSPDAWGRNVVPNGYASPLLDYVDTIGTSVDLIACSGATTRNVVRGGVEQYPGEGGSQIDQRRLSAATDLVTISIGGNDVGFSNIVTACARNGCAAGEVDGQPVFDYAADTLKALPGNLDEALAQIRDEAPDATVLLLGYPRLFSDTAEERDTCPMISRLWDVDSQAWMNTKAAEVSDVMRRAAERNGAWYLSPIDTFDNHEICGSEGEWLEGVRAPNAFDLFHGGLVGTGSFHPNREGHLDGYAALVNDFLAQAAADGVPTNAAGLPVNPAPVRALARTTAAAEPTGTVTSVGALDVSQVPGVDQTACYPEGLVGSARRTRLWGAGFAPGSAVQVVWGGEGGTESVLGTATASAAGQVATTVTTPAATPDTYARMYLRGGTAQGGRREVSALLGVGRACPGTEDPTYAFEGFFAPVDNPPVLNQMAAGRAVPVKFSLGGDQGLDVLAAGAPSSSRVSCATGATVDVVEQTVTAGSSSLTYDAGTRRYQYVWKTSKEWAGTCRQLTVTLDDGTSHRASFAFR